MLFVSCAIESISRIIFSHTYYSWDCVDVCEITKSHCSWPKNQLRGPVQLGQANLLATNYVCASQSYISDSVFKSTITCMKLAKLNTSGETPWTELLDCVCNEGPVTYS